MTMKLVSIEVCCVLHATWDLVSTRKIWSALGNISRSIRVDVEHGTGYNRMSRGDEPPLVVAVIMAIIVITDGLNWVSRIPSRIVAYKYMRRVTGKSVGDTHQNMRRDGDLK